MLVRGVFGIISESDVTETVIKQGFQRDVDVGIPRSNDVPTWKTSRSVKWFEFQGELLNVVQMADKLNAMLDQSCEHRLVQDSKLFIVSGLPPESVSELAGALTANAGQQAYQQAYFDKLK